MVDSSPENDLHRRFALLLGLSCSLLIARPARAADPGFVVISDAPAKSKFTTELRARISELGHVAAPEATSRGLAGVGHEGSAARFLDDDPPDDADRDRACMLAERLLGDFTLIVHRSPRGGKAHLILIRAEPCAVVLTKDVAASDDVKLAAAVSEEVWTAVNGESEKSDPTPVETKKEPPTVAVPPPVATQAPTSTPPSSKAAPPKPPKSAPTFEPAIEEEPLRDSKDSSAEGLSPRVALQLGPRLVMRDFSYHELRSKNLFEFGSKAPTLAFRLRADVVPFVNEKHAGRFFGIGGTVASSFGGDSETRAGDSSPSGKLGTKYFAFDAYLSVAIPLSKSLKVGGRLGYAHTSYTFDVPETEKRLAPSSTYSALRIGPRVDYSAGKALFFAEFDYLQAFSAGTAANRFENPSSLGLELSLGSGYAITKKVALIGELTGTRFISFFQPKDGLVATGAIDLYGTFDIGVRVSF